MDATLSEITHRRKLYDHSSCDQPRSASAHVKVSQQKTQRVYARRRHIGRSCMPSESFAVVVDIICSSLNRLISPGLGGSVNALSSDRYSCTRLALVRVASCMPQASPRAHSNTRIVAHYPLPLRSLQTVGGDRLSELVRESVYGGFCRGEFSHAVP